MIIATSAPKKWKIGAELIKFYQKTEYSHILIIDNDLVYQASNGDVNCMHIDVFLENNNIIDVLEVEDHLVDMDFVKKQLGRKYAFLQLANIATRYLLGIKLSKNDGNQKFICSELVGKALHLDWVNDQTNPRQVFEYLKNGNS